MGLWWDCRENCCKNLLDSLAVPSVGLVPQLKSLVNASRGSRWNCSPRKINLCKTNTLLVSLLNRNCQTISATASNTWRCPSLWWGRPRRWGFPWSRRSGGRGSSWWASCWQACGSERWRLFQQSCSSHKPIFDLRHVTNAVRVPVAIERSCQGKEKSRRRQMLAQKIFSRVLSSWHATLSKGKSRPGKMFVSSFCVPYFLS